MNTDIRIAVSFRGHRKRRKLKMLLGPGATDYLLDLWIATAMNHPDGVLAGMDHMDIALEAGWEDNPDRFVSALVDCGFLETTEEGVYCLHDWVDHQPYVRGAPVRAERARKGALAKWGIDPEEGQEHPQTKRHERLAEARKKGTHTKEQWDSMVGLFEGTCVRCGQTEADLVKDHITPIYQGGSDGIENIQPLCRKCNSSKGPESKDYRGIMASRMGKKVPEDWCVDACLVPASRLLAPAQTPAPSPSPSPDPDPEPKPKPSLPTLPCGGGKDGDALPSAENSPKRSGDGARRATGGRGKIAYSEGFERFWKNYPRRIAKDAAWLAWGRTMAGAYGPAPPEEALITAARRYSEWCLAKGRDDEHILHGSTFLGPQRRWVDFVSGASGAGDIPSAAAEEQAKYTDERGIVDARAVLRAHREMH